MSLTFKKSFCSHICPVGYVSEHISRRGKGLGIPVFIPIWVLKYLLLGFFVYVIFFGMSLASVQAFIYSPYNAISDYRMLQLFSPPSLTTITVLSVLMGLTLLFKNFWCKYLCPYGALLGLCSLLSPVVVTRNSAGCVDCGKCTSVCPAAIQVHKKRKIRSPDCIGCHDCIRNCPADGCLSVNQVKYRLWFPLIPLVLFLIIIAAAMLTGHWKSIVTNEQYKAFMDMKIGHP